MNAFDPSPDQRPTPNGVIKDMYLEINNLSQGLNIGLLVLVLASPGFYQSIPAAYFSTPLLAGANLTISIIFWIRYYFDTEILQRSFTLTSIVWYFAYLVAQGLSISFIATPPAWLASTGFFLFFGAGFYGLNLREIQRKTDSGLLRLRPAFLHWQRARMVELAVASALAWSGAYLVGARPALALPAAGIALAAAVWQLLLTDAYRKQQFIETGA